MHQKRPALLAFASPLQMLLPPTALAGVCHTVEALPQTHGTWYSVSISSCRNS